MGKSIRECVEEIFAPGHTGKSGPVVNLAKQWKADPQDVEKTEKIIKYLLDECSKQFKDISKGKDTHAIGDFQDNLDKLVKMSDYYGNLQGFIGYQTRYDVSIPMWGSTLDMITFTIARKTPKMLSLVEVKEDFIRIIEYVDKSKEQIIEAVKRDNPDENLDDYQPQKVLDFIFDYSGEIPEYHFHLESLAEYSFCVYIKEDLSFDAGYIS